MHSPAEGRGVLKPDESKTDFARFYDEIGAAQIEERYYTRFDYALARYYLLIDVLSRQARPGRRLLDVGCASGYYTAAYGKAGGEATGVDLSEASVELARRRADAAGVGGRCEFLAGDMRELPVPDASHDLVLMSEVIEHVREPDQAFAEVARVLRPGGTAIVATPNAMDWSTPRERLRHRKTAKADETPVPIERTGTNESVTEAGIEHEEYFHNFFTFRELAGLMPPEMEVRRAHSLWFNPTPKMISRYMKLDARLNRFRGSLTMSALGEAAEISPGEPVDFPPPTAASKLIVGLAKAIWRVPVANQAGREIFMVARRRP